MYDQLASVNGVEKIKTIGDCYMAATGLPERNSHHAQALCRFGLQMLSKLKHPRTQIVNPCIKDDPNYPDGIPILMRLGIHSSSAIAGIVGYQKYVYDVWGDAVFLA